MSKNPGSKREIIELSEVPRSSTPEPVSKRPKASRSTSKVPARDSRARGVIVSAAGTSEPGGSSIGRPARTPAIERSSERPSGEVHASDQELADDDDDPLLHRIRRECERCVKDCEERLKKSQVEGEMQSILIDKIKLEMRERMPTMPREVPLPCSMSRSAMS